VTWQQVRTNPFWKGKTAVDDYLNARSSAFDQKKNRKNKKYLKLILRQHEILLGKKFTPFYKKFTVCCSIKNHHKLFAFIFMKVNFDFERSPHYGF
jgi:hypothetical protein